MNEKLTQLAPLMLFTWLVTLASGIALAALGSLQNNDPTGTISSGMFAVAAVLSVAGLGLGVLHLGRPLRAWRAAAGLGHSPLSREILAVGVFALACGYAAAAPGMASGALAAAAGLASILSITAVYSLPAQDGWNRWFVRLTPFADTLLLGAALGDEPLATAAILGAALLLSLARLRPLRAQSGPPEGSAVVAMALRLLLLGTLAVVTTLDATGVSPFIAAGAIACERWAFYAGAVRITPKSSIARIRKERLEEAAREVVSSDNKR